MVEYRLGIVIPAFNEAATIANIVQRVGEYGVAIVIDDGSVDKTAEIAGRAGAVVLSHAVNKGYDAALNLGFKKAAELGMDIIITVDADGQHDPSLIKKFIAEIELGADVVVGARNYQQRFGEYLFGWYLAFRFGIHDPLCGMKAYKTDVYSSLGYFDSYKSIGTELMIYAAKKSFRITQIEISTHKRIDQPRFGRSLIGNYKIIRALLISIYRYA